MIVLDTNVISELMRPEPHQAVRAWVAAQPRSTLYTTSINRAEILYGIACLPAGRRRERFEVAAAAIRRISVVASWHSMTVPPSIMPVSQLHGETPALRSTASMR